MTLTQLNAFVLVARLGSVTSAASALGVSESAVSQALTALRQHLGRIARPYPLQAARHRRPPAEPVIGVPGTSFYLRVVIEGEKGSEQP